MFPETFSSIPLDPISLPDLEQQEIRLSVLRLDAIDPLISGNKWFKLKYNLKQAQALGYQRILSFGGPYSNHLHALAYAGMTYGFKTVGIIRGEEHLPLNPTLTDAVSNGMRLYYIKRDDYRNKHTAPVQAKIKQLVARDDPQPYYLVPEGGTNLAALQGAAEIARIIPEDTDYLCIPCGTGGTLAGILQGLEQAQSAIKVLGFAAMKGGHFLHQDIASLLALENTPVIVSDWQINCDYHFGGFGKINPQLVDFISDFEKKQGLELDPVYTAKMMYGIVDLLKQNYFTNKSHIVAIHTGGLQGKRGMQAVMRQ
jgi:1-aminocyclopropane-1-carboxylate deaminase/D-cysteine desulfhydrase-like pyridoxal-dependent ACC family enzyme